MPAIIAAHIAHNRSSRGASQVAVIIHADAPVMGPYMSRAIATTHAQHASGRPMRRRASVMRGRSRADSTTVRSVKPGILSERVGPVIGRISYDRIVLLSRP